MEKRQQDQPIVFIDDAHTLGGTQTALARVIQVILSKTCIPILCICTPRTRKVIEDIVGPEPRLQFETAPSALPLNLFLFLLRLPAYWFLLRRVRRQGVRAWWLNLPDIEFCLAPLTILRLLGEDARTYIHGTGSFTFFHRAASRKRRLLSKVRDAVANQFVFQFHSIVIAASRTSQREVESRITSNAHPYINYMYHPPMDRPAHRIPPIDAHLDQPLELWMIGNVIQGHKNNWAALDVLEELARRGKTATLTLSGVGPDLDRFRQDAAQRGLSDWITYLGWVNDPCSIVPKDATVFIPSFHETMNLVAREAMQYGLRVVVSPIPIFHEWIPELLIADESSPAAFADRILTVQEIGAEKLQEMYRYTLDKFSYDIFIESFLRYTTMSVSASRSQNRID